MNVLQKLQLLLTLSVSWVQCAEEQRHVPESLYPFTFNPKMSLNLSQVPSSSQRSPPLTRTQLKEISEAKDETVSPLSSVCPHFPAIFPFFFIDLFSALCGDDSLCVCLEGG